MKLKEKEERDKQREKEREEKDKLREKEKDERRKLEDRNKKDREEKERMKQREKEEKYKQKEERDKQRQREREEREKEKKREKEKREKEKQKLRDERIRYNERFKNANYKLIAKNLRNNNSKNSINPFNLKQIRSQGNYYQRQAYNSKRLFPRRRFSHKRIQPKNRIPRLEPKKKLGKTSMKIIKPKRYDEDETDSEVNDFEDRLLKFPRFKAKYGKNFVLKKPAKNKYINLTSYISNHSGKNIIDYKRPEMEQKMGETKKTNLTISEIEEEEDKNFKKRKMPLSKVKPKNAKINMNKKMREILGKQYKLLMHDPLNPYGTWWPSNFLKMGYDTGFEYDNFQSGVPVLKLKTLGKKQLPPVKKKGQGMHFNNNNGIYSPNKKEGKHPLFPNNTAKKNFVHDDFGKDEKDNNIKVNKSQTIKASNNNE